MAGEGRYCTRPLGELLLELSEEIPAGMQRRAIAELDRLLRDKLAAAEIPAAAYAGYVTPRRLTVIARGHSGGPAGPQRGAPRAPCRRAASRRSRAFCGRPGIASIEECEVRDTGRGEFYFATINRPGRPAAEVLPELVRAAIFELPWPKSMRYPASSLRWVRPLTSVICLFDGEVLPLPLDRVAVGRMTRGHRFLSPGEICVGNADDYLERLRQRACRSSTRIAGGRRSGRISKRAARRAGFMLKPDPGLLDEVTGLVEFPVVLAGRDRRRFHGAAARSAGDRDADASEIFLLPAARRRAGAAVPVRRQQSRRGRRQDDHRRQ